MTVARLLGQSAIARRLGVSRQRAHVLAGRPDFPTPAHELDTGRVWRETDIERWIRRNPQYDHTRTFGVTWVCASPRCHARSEPVTPTPRGRCPHCDRTVVAVHDRP